MGRKYSNLNVCITPFYGSYGVQGGYFYTYHADDYFLFNGMRKCQHVIGNYLGNRGALNFYVHFISHKFQKVCLIPPITGKCIVHINDILSWLRIVSLNNRPTKDGRFSMRLKNNIRCAFFDSVELRYTEDFRPRIRAQNAMYYRKSESPCLRNCTEFFQDKLDSEINRRYGLK